MYDANNTVDSRIEMANNFIYLTSQNKIINKHTTKLS